MPRKILVILGQPQRQSYGGALAAAYVEGAREAGAEVRELCVGELKFNACAASGKGHPEVEADLKAAQDAIRWADHLVFVYPIWWGTIPAILKGFIERVFTEGFAVKFHDGDPWWDRLLKGRSARLIVTMNTPPLYYRFVFGRPGHRTMKNTILEFCGVKPVRITEFGPVRGSSEDKRRRWLESVRALGRALG
jgi:putative NADPH-quinone reductase